MESLHKDKHVYKHICEEFSLKLNFSKEFVSKIKKDILGLNISFLKIVSFIS